MNLNDVADGIDRLLAPIGVRASIWRPDPKPPCVLVVVDTLTNWTFEDFQEANITLILIAGEVGTEPAVRAMNDYLDLEHEDSIVHALRADPTLSGTVGSSDVTDIRNYTPYAVDPQGVKHTYVEFVLVAQGP